MGYTVIQGLFPRKNAIPFFLKKQQKAFSTPIMREEHITGSKWWTMSLFNGLTNVLFHVCLTNIAFEDLTWSYGPLVFIMFVCHYNMFVLMFVVVPLLFYWLIILFLFLFWHIWVLPAQLQIWFTFSFHLRCTMWSISCIFMHYVPLSWQFLLN